jgi:hypothetical protein
MHNRVKLKRKTNLMATRLIKHNALIRMELEFQLWSFHLFILKVEFLVTELLDKKIHNAYNKIRIIFNPISSSVCFIVMSTVHLFFFSLPSKLLLLINFFLHSYSRWMKCWVRRGNSRNHLYWAYEQSYKWVRHHIFIQDLKKLVYRSSNL